MFLNILVAYDGSRSARRAWEQAIDLARSQNSKLTVITVAPPVPPFAAFAGVSIERMKDELETWAGHMNREAADAAPDGVVVHTVQRSGHAGEEIVKEIDRGGYDLVVLGSRGHGQVGSSVLGSVNGYVHFHSKVALLSIDDPEHQGSARPGPPSHG